jgi:hypothetical protein
MPRSLWPDVSAPRLSTRERPDHPDLRVAGETQATAIAGPRALTGGVGGAGTGGRRSENRWGDAARTACRGRAFDCGVDWRARARLSAGPDCRRGRTVGGAGLSAGPDCRRAGCPRGRTAHGLDCRRGWTVGRTAPGRQGRPAAGPAVIRGRDRRGEAIPTRDGGAKWGIAEKIVIDAAHPPLCSTVFELRFYNRSERQATVLTVDGGGMWSRVERGGVR